MFLSDEAVTTIKDDRLDRKKFSNFFATALSKWKNKESLVVSINGGWGFGKTSVINFTIEQITKKYQSNFDVIFLNPWEFSSQNKNLNYIVIEKVAEKIKFQDANQKTKNISNNLVSYAKFISIIANDKITGNIKNILFSVGGMFSISGVVFNQFLGSNYYLILYIVGIILIILSWSKPILEAIAEYYEHLSKTKLIKIADLKNEINQEIMERKKTILIIIDDLDRMYPNEICTIFKTIKNNLDFKNMIFVVACDRRLIEKAVSKELGVNGKEFLEKIIQVDFNLPMVSQDKIEVLLLEEINKLLAKYPDDKFDQTYWINIYHSGLKDMFRNPRDIKRFINSLSFNMSLINQKTVEVNLVDFITLETIRIFQSDFYNELRNNKSLFIDIESMHSSNNSSREKARKEAINKIFVNTIKIEQQEKMKELIFRIFPQVKGLFNNTYYSDSNKEWDKGLHLCSALHFDTYFSLIPGGSSDSANQYEVNEILDNIGNDKLNLKLKYYLDKGKLNKILKLLNVFLDKITKEKSLELIISLGKISEFVKEDDRSNWDSLDSNIRFCTSRLLDNFESNGVVFNDIKNIVKTVNDLYFIAIIIDILKRRIDKRSGEKIILDETKIKKVTKLFINKVKANFNNQKFNLGSRYFLQILFFYKRHVSAQEFKNLIEKIIKKDARFIEFLALFLINVKSQYLEDYAVTKSKELDKKSLFAALEEKYILERLNKIQLKSKNLKTKKIIKLLEDQIKKESIN